MAKHILPASVAAIGTTAFLWNAFGGVMAYQNVVLAPSKLGAMSYAQQQVHLMTPLWANLALVATVIAGLIGSIGLIRGRRWAAAWFLLSALAMLVQLVGSVFASPKLDAHGIGSLAFPAAVLAVCAFLWSYSHRAEARGWLR